MVNINLEKCANQFNFQNVDFKSIVCSRVVPEA